MTGAGVPDVGHFIGGRIDGDVSCYGCGYNLRGLDRSAACPECGESIDASVRGDVLALASEPWLRRLRRGATLLVAAMLVPYLAVISAAIAALVTAPLAHPQAQSGEVAFGLGFLLLLAAPLLAAVAIHLLLTPDPRGDSSPLGVPARLGAYGSIVTGFVAALVPVLLVASTAAAVGAAALVCALGTVPAWGVFRCVEELARRAPHLSLAKRAVNVRTGIVGSLGVLALGLAFWAADGVAAAAGNAGAVPEAAVFLANLLVPLGVIGTLWTFAHAIAVVDALRGVLQRALWQRDRVRRRSARNGARVAASPL